MPLFSVITITKNNPLGYKRTKQSIESQTCKNYEWLVIDGDVEPDNGIYDAMNKGIERAMGDYVMFMNAGDAFAHPDVLADISGFLPCDFIYGDSLEEGHIKKARHHSKVKYGMFTHHQSMVYRRDLMHGLRFDENYPIAADYKLTLQYFIRADHIVYYPKSICVFEEGGISQQNAAQGRKEQQSIRKALGIAAPMVILYQKTGLFLRRYAPWLYWFIKSR